MTKSSTLDSLKAYVVPVISLLAVVVLVWSVVLPQLTAIADASKIIRTNKNRLSQIEEKSTKLNDLAGSRKDEISNNLKMIETVLPISKDVAALILGVQDLARNNGLSVSAFKIQPGKTATASAAKSTSAGTSPVSAAPESTKDNMVFNMTLSGPMTSLKTFLAAIETGKRILTLSQVKATGSGGGFSFDLFLNAPFGALPDLTSDPIGTPLAVETAKNKKLLEDLKTPIFSDITGKTVQTGPTGPIDPFAGN